MIVRPGARFQSSLPEDVFEDEDGRFLQPPGKSVADAIAVMAGQLGYTVVGGPEPVLDLGWELELERAKSRFRLVINPVDDYWMFVQNLSWADKILRRRPPAYLDLLRGLARSLAADNRFTNIRWYVDRSEAEGPGTAYPVPDHAAGGGRAP